MSFSGVIRRLGRADGSSHVRALAYQSAFVLMSGFIGLVGLASLLDLEQLRVIVQEMALRVSPSSSGRLLQEAVQHGASGGGTAATVGLGAALVSGTLAMAQLGRSAERLHAISIDAPPMRRYVRAVVLALGGLVIGAGRSIATGDRMAWFGCHDVGGGPLAHRTRPCGDRDRRDLPGRVAGSSNDP